MTRQPYISALFILFTVACVEKSASDKSFAPEVHRPDLEPQEQKELDDLKNTIAGAKKLLSDAVIGDEPGQYKQEVRDNLAEAIALAETKTSITDVGTYKTSVETLRLAIAAFQPLTRNAAGDVVQPNPLPIDPKLPLPPAVITDPGQLDEKLASSTQTAQFLLDYEDNLPKVLSDKLESAIQGATGGTLTKEEQLANLEAAIESVRSFRKLDVTSMEQRIKELRAVCQRLQSATCEDIPLLVQHWPNLAEEVKNTYASAQALLDQANAGNDLLTSWKETQESLANLTQWLHPENVLTIDKAAQNLKALGKDISSLSEVANELRPALPKGPIFQGRLRLAGEHRNKSLCLVRGQKTGLIFPQLSPCHLESAAIWSLDLNGQLCNEDLCLAQSNEAGAPFNLAIKAEPQPQGRATLTVAENGHRLSINGRNVGFGGQQQNSRVYYSVGLGNATWQLEPVSHPSLDTKATNNLRALDEKINACHNCFGRIGKGPDKGFVAGGNSVQDLLSKAREDSSALTNTEINQLDRNFLVRGVLHTAVDECLNFKSEKDGAFLVEENCRFDRGHFNIYPNGTIKTEKDTFCLTVKTGSPTFNQYNPYRSSARFAKSERLALEPCPKAGQGEAKKFQFQPAGEDGKSKLVANGKALHTLWVKIFEGDGDIVYGEKGKRGKGSHEGDLIDSLDEVDIKLEHVRVSRLSCRAGNRLDQLKFTYASAQWRSTKTLKWGGGGGNSCSEVVELAENEHITGVRICDYNYKPWNKPSPRRRTSRIQVQRAGDSHDHWTWEKNNDCETYYGERLIGFYGRKDKDEVRALMPIFTRKK